MKKRLCKLVALAAVLCALAGCGHSHTWTEADCLTAKTCAECGETEGVALGHDWQEATCAAPKTCARCQETEGEALGHDWQEATCAAPETCARCGETQGEILPHLGMGFNIQEDAETGEILFLGDCGVCGQNLDSSYPDWDTLGKERVIGDWEFFSWSDGQNNAWVNDGSLEEVAEDHFLIREDGTAEFTMTGELFTGQWYYVDRQTTEENTVWCFYFDSPDGSFYFYYMVEEMMGAEVVGYVGEDTVFGYVRNLASVLAME